MRVRCHAASKQVFVYVNFNILLGAPFSVEILATNGELAMVLSRCPRQPLRSAAAMYS